MIDVVREPLQVTYFDGHRVGACRHRPSKTPAPGLVMIPEIFGINLPLREMAARYAREGFAVLVLDIFSRMERDVDVGYDDAEYPQNRSAAQASTVAGSGWGTRSRRLPLRPPAESRVRLTVR